MRFGISYLVFRKVADYEEAVYIMCFPKHQKK